MSPKWLTVCRDIRWHLRMRLNCLRGTEQIADHIVYETTEAGAASKHAISSMHGFHISGPQHLEPCYTAHSNKVKVLFIVDRPSSMKLLRIPMYFCKITFRSYKCTVLLGRDGLGRDGISKGCWLSAALACWRAATAAWYSSRLGRLPLGSLLRMIYTCASPSTNARSNTVLSPVVSQRVLQAHASYPRCLAVQLLHLMLRTNKHSGKQYLGCRLALCLLTDVSQISA